MVPAAAADDRADRPDRLPGAVDRADHRHAATRPPGPRRRDLAVRDGHRLGRSARAVGLRCGWAAQAAGTTRDAFAELFGESAPVVPPSDGYYNILLLGADSGEGRDSMRFDSISVVSINADTGATTITGIPRDMPHFPFAPGPMQDEYPNGHTGYANATCGWGSGINQLRTEVEVCQDGNKLYPNAVSQGSEPGIEATKDAAEGIMGIQIPYYVLIDMKGFADLVDALGGVDIDVKERLPKGGPATTGSPSTTGRSAGSRPGSSTWTATPPSGTRGRATRPATSTACAASVSCKRRSSPRPPAERAGALPGGRRRRDQHRRDRSAAGPDRPDPGQSRPQAKDQPVQTLELTPRAASTSSNPTTTR